MENQELIKLLRERGYDVKSASSSIDNISAESFREEFGPKADETKTPETDSADDASAPQVHASPAPPSAAPKPVLPPGAVVRSRADVERERKERQEAQQAPAAPPPPPPPEPPQRVRPGSGVVAPPPAPGEKSDSGKEQKTTPPSSRTQEKPAASRASGPTPVAPPRSPQPLRPPQIKPPSPVSPPPASKEESSAAEPGVEEQTAGDDAGDVRKIQVKPPIVVRDFAKSIGLRPFQLISELMEMNIFASMNQILEEDVAQRIAEKHNIVLEVRHRGESQQVAAKRKQEPEEPVDESKFLEPRPPVVCILGHVDHGKTTLLDAVRQTHVVDGEAGGITQHIGAYQVEHNDRKVTFIDTPGHAAFSRMRMRGAEVTDIAVLVVAADDGFMPQTDEALGHARVAKVPVVVAINKTDVKGANIDRVKQQMQERGIAPEDWGGETLCVLVSAITGEGIGDLLEALLLQAEIMELKANPRCAAEGVVIETQKEVGRGSTASVIVKRGTLRQGDAIVCGQYYCRVRSLVDDAGRGIKSALPSTPVKVIGWNGTPEAGALFRAEKNERVAKRLAEENEEAFRKEQYGPAVQEAGPAASIDDLFAAIERTQVATFPVVVKADVYGTSEALATSLESIKSEKIKLQVIDTGVGAVSKNDILMCSAAKAAIVAFNVSLENGAGAFAKHHGIRIFQHDIIYELIDAVKDAMADQLEPELRENKLGAAEVRQVFPVAKGLVAGCLVTEGRVQRDARARLLRKGEVVGESRVSALKRFKNDATEVRAGYECGISLGSLNKYEPGDVIECFTIEKVKPEL